MDLTTSPERNQTSAVPTAARWDWRRGGRWFAAEFLVVVTGVLVALALNAWFTARTHRQQERELLVALRSEFVANRTSYDQYVDRHHRMMARARRMLELTGPTVTGINSIEIDTLIFDLLDPFVYEPTTRQVEAALSSGQFTLIRNDSLRAALAAWPDQFRLLRRMEEISITGVTLRLIPYLFKRIPITTMDHRLAFIDTPRPSRFKQDYVGLLSDMEFENYVEDRWVNSIYTLAAGVAGRKMMDEVIRLIDAQLEN